MVGLFCEDETPGGTATSHKKTAISTCCSDDFIEDTKIKVILMQAYGVAAAMTVGSDG
jgi:hypothetical protein